MEDSESLMGRKSPPLEQVSLMFSFWFVFFCYFIFEMFFYISF